MITSSTNKHNFFLHLYDACEGFRAFYYEANMPLKHIKETPQISLSTQKCYFT